MADGTPPTLDDVPDVYTIADLRAGHADGTDTLRNVELLKFSDGTVSLTSAFADWHLLS